MKAKEIITQIFKGLEQGFLNTGRLFNKISGALIFAIFAYSMDFYRTGTIKQNFSLNFIVFIVCLVIIVNHLKPLFQGQGGNER